MMAFSLRSENRVARSEAAASLCGADHRDQELPQQAADHVAAHGPPAAGFFEHGLQQCPLLGLHAELPFEQRARVLAVHVEGHGEEAHGLAGLRVLAVPLVGAVEHHLTLAEQVIAPAGDAVHAAPVHVGELI